MLLLGCVSLIHCQIYINLALERSFLSESSSGKTENQKYPPVEEKKPPIDYFENKNSEERRYLAFSQNKDKNTAQSDNNPFFYNLLSCCSQR